MHLPGTDLIVEVWSKANIADGGTGLLPHCRPHVQFAMHNGSSGEQKVHTYVNGWFTRITAHLPTVIAWVSFREAMIASSINCGIAS
jgi:hypothetical protein